jgi:hypothetical protein
LQQIVRMLLSNSIRDTDIDISDLLQEINRKYPSLFESFLPYSEHETLRSQLDSLIDEDKVPLIGSKTYLNPAAIGYITTAFARGTLKLPVKTTDLDDSPHF